ncbi:MAG: ABC transporter substrate-binding protein [Methanothrix sp.]|jgi:iron complex transport system substrate-binding protein|uniref:ABC transporter substrate-binding protein n=1 Tax=Methanothrix TaxID=2222 RepID=UPI0025FDE17C|nr:MULTISPECIES: ABC transporter substrate-binding protein [Methanothrix]MBK7386508.1 ABC transporter substrate-binding protein [Methanothrix sp.]HPY92924.1 ABC transporter substrate-binding protein [Methanothrix soehngenii]
MIKNISSHSVILVALCLSVAITPVIADWDSFHRADENTLAVYGNANLDNVIDEDDIEYVQGILDGTEDETQFADANYDGQISEEDIVQIRAIISGNETELTLLDMAGRAVTVPGSIERVVSAAGLDSTRALVYLGDKDKIVGIGMNSSSWSLINYAAPELAKVPVVGSDQLNLELIATLKPDVILAGTRSNLDKIQEKTHIPTVGVLSGIDSCLAFDMLRTIGWTMRSEGRAEELISYADRKICEATNITSQIPEDEKPRVYSCSGLHEGITTALSYKLVIEAAGGIDVAPELANSSKTKVSKENIIDWNPDIIILHNGNPEEIKAVLSDPVLQSVNAVKNERIYPVMIGLGGKGILAESVTQVLYLTKIFHPDRFESLDVEKEGNEILKTFYGIDGLYTELENEFQLYSWD